MAKLKVWMKSTAYTVKIRQKDFEITLFGRLKLIFLVLALDEVKIMVQITVK